MSDNTLEPAVDDTGNQHTRWLKIVEMSKELRRLAQRSDWSELNTLSERRDVLLNEFFQQDLAPGMRDIVVEDIKTIREIDEDTLTLVQKNKDLLADEIIRLQVKRKRLHSYISNSE